MEAEGIVTAAPPTAKAATPKKQNSFSFFGGSRSTSESKSDEHHGISLGNALGFGGVDIWKNGILAKSPSQDKVEDGDEENAPGADNEKPKERKSAPRRTRTKRMGMREKHEMQKSAHSITFLMAMLFIVTLIGSAAIVLLIRLYIDGSGRICWAVIRSVRTGSLFGMSIAIWSMGFDYAFFDPKIHQSRLIFDPMQWKDVTFACFFVLLVFIVTLTCCDEQPLYMLDDGRDDKTLYKIAYGVETVAFAVAVFGPCWTHYDGDWCVGHAQLSPSR